MNLNQLNGTNSTKAERPPRDDEHKLVPPSQPVATNFDETTTPIAGPKQKFPTRTEKATGSGLDKKKLLLLGGVLLAAILFFAITAIIGKSHSRPKALHTNAGLKAKAQAATRAKESVTPIMEAARKPRPESTDGQLSPEDIKRTRPTQQGMRAGRPNAPPRPDKPIAGAQGALSSVPAFSDTQQRWE
jgi:hypothetical protein